MQVLVFVVGTLAAVSAIDCPPGFFECKHGRFCIPEAWVCDGKNDCIDRSDEPADCPPCPVGRWLCANGNCVPGTYICDGDDDCGDMSDEVDPVTGICPSCPDFLFQCSVTGRCVEKSNTCNGDDDCGDASDETEEACPCAASEHRCKKQEEGGLPGACIPPEFICDRIYDCPLHDDEVNCTEKSAHGRFTYNSQRIKVKTHKLHVNNQTEPNKSN